MPDLKSRLGGHIYIPPQTPPLVKEGLVANLWFATFGMGDAGVCGETEDAVGSTELRWQLEQK